MNRKITNLYKPNQTAAARFHDPLHIEAHGLPIKDRPWELLQNFRFYSAILGKVITVPKGYRTDFASVPRFFWRIIPPYGRYAKAAVAHDWLCDLRGSTGIDSATTHKVFLEAMEILEVPAWKRTVMYRAVRWFGPRFSSHLIEPTDSF